MENEWIVNFEEQRGGYSSSSKFPSPAWVQDISDMWLIVPLISSGVLVDARQDEHIGVAAALEIFTWKDAVITLDALSRGRSATIHNSVTELLLESARLADERERNARRSGTQGGTSVRHEAVAAGASKGPGLSLVPAPGPVGPRRPAGRPAVRHGTQRRVRA